MKENNKPSPYPYEQIMSSISDFQGKRAAIVILENEDGSTTYLRHNISEEDVVSLLKSSYQ